MASYDDLSLPACQVCHAAPALTLTPEYQGKYIYVAARCHGDSQTVRLTWTEMCDLDGPGVRALLQDRLTILAPRSQPAAADTQHQTMPPPYTPQERGHAADGGGGRHAVDQAVIDWATQRGYRVTRVADTHTLSGDSVIQSPVITTRAQQGTKWN